MYHNIKLLISFFYLIILFIVISFALIKDSSTALLVSSAIISQFVLLALIIFIYILIKNKKINLKQYVSQTEINLSELIYSTSAKSFYLLATNCGGIIGGAIVFFIMVIEEDKFSYEFFIAGIFLIILFFIIDYFYWYYAGIKKVELYNNAIRIFYGKKNKELIVPFTKITEAIFIQKKDIKKIFLIFPNSNKISFLQDTFFVFGPHIFLTEDSFKEKEFYEFFDLLLNALSNQNIKIIEINQ